ncbi:MAG TPA: shikimate dehydrogenase [Chlamydiales bacterium]|nr:shikimate dehydrogenase [Chlamydiales bacterium]
MIFLYRKTAFVKDALMLFLSLSRLQETQYTDKSLAMELRVDLLDRIDLEEIQNFLRNSIRPVLLTVRKASQGGKFQGGELERETLIQRLLALEPPFFDLEWDMSPTFLREMIESHPKTKFILSYHNFQEVPANLDEIYQSMQKYAVFHYKIAAMAHSTNDALKLLLFAKKYSAVSAICMGEKGAFARVLGPIAGNRIGYASAGEKTGPGQLTVQELVDVYRYPFLNEKTAIYGLIGDPVEKSPGHRYHNAVFQKRGLNAVYVKMVVKPEELQEFIPLAKTIGIQGLSVTIPLKEKILPFLDWVEPAAKPIGAVNTLAFKNGQIGGTNTDGLGALDAIEKRGPVRGKKVVLLGAGGAARAIAFEAKVRGADVWILNRTVQRAKELARELGGEAGGLDEVPNDYDVLINCSPDPMPIDPQKMKPNALAMDVVYAPRETDFLKAAALKGCSLIYGEEMFLNQAARQTAFWRGS